MRQPGQGVQGEERLARFARRPVATSEFYPELERFVRYDADPFAARSDRGGAAIASAPYPTPVGEASASAREAGPTIIALLGRTSGGPVRRGGGRGRPPAEDDRRGRRRRKHVPLLPCGVGPVGPSAAYTFLYVV
jgi:hypothetical protein